MEIEKEKTKVLIMGLDNAGKTSIILSMQKGTNILTFFRLNPTKGINRVNFEDLTTNYSCWDFGGQEQFRSEYIEKMENHIIGSRKLIFVIDIQEKDRFELALEYYKKIIDSIESSSELREISIFLHKYDPDLESDNNINDNISFLNTEIKKITPNTFNLSFFKTTIFTVFNKAKIE